ncbi:MAG: NAD(P)/FAD-dependent oxidoreductase, partial [Clostridium sp.]
MYDILIIGAGVIGASIARELSKYKLKICVLEKNYDIANGTSKANSGIIHAGFDAEPNTLKGKLNVIGNFMFDALQKELNFPFRRNGSLVLGFSDEDKHTLLSLIKRGMDNSVPNLQLLDQNEIIRLEPNVNPLVKYALYAPTAGILSPYEFTIALCENAWENGVEFKLNSKVTSISSKNSYFEVQCNDISYSSKIIINAAGVYSDEINNMISNNKFTITGRKGEYILLDKKSGILVTSTLFRTPTKYGKGVLVTQTVDGNLLVGPTAIDVDNKDDTSTSKDGLNELVNKGKEILRDFPDKNIISAFAGIRANNSTGDFIIEEASDVKNFFNVLGIDSPGLTAAPAIALLIKDLLSDKILLENKDNFLPYRKSIQPIRSMSNKKKMELIKDNP